MDRALYGDSDTPPHLVAFYDHAGDTEVHILALTPRALKGGGLKKLMALLFSIKQKEEDVATTVRRRGRFICRPRHLMEYV